MDEYLFPAFLLMRRREGLAIAVRRARKLAGNYAKATIGSMMDKTEFIQVKQLHKSDQQTAARNLYADADPFGESRCSESKSIAR